MSLTSLNALYQKAAQVGIAMRSPPNAHAAYVQHEFTCKPQKKISTPNPPEITGSNPPSRRDETVRGNLASIPASLTPAVTAMNMYSQVSTVTRRLLVPAIPAITSRRIYVTVGLVLVSRSAVPSRPAKLPLMLMDAIFARRCWRRLRRA